MAAERPVPMPDHESAEFWRRVGSHAMAFQRCADCKTVRFYPRALCPQCLSERVEWVPVSGRGSLYSFTVCHRPASEAFAAATPYIVALVDLAEGVRLMSNLIDCPPGEARVGMPVTLIYEDVGPSQALYKFRPAPA
jgi:uncharacterized OB-fold protein